MEKLEKFIAWDSINTIEASFSSNHYHKIIQSKYEHMSKFQTAYPSYILSKLSSFLFRTNNSRKNVIFSSNKYPHLIDKTSENFNCSIINQVLFSVNKKIPFIYTSDVAKCIYNYYVRGDVEYIYDGIYVCKKTLNAIQPDCVIFPQDSLPLERMIISACKEMGIPTINIQDGIYQLGSSPLHGKAADYIFVWGDLFKKYYIDNNINNADRIFVIGYPYDRQIPSMKKPNGGKIKAYYLGQNIEHYNPDLLNHKLKTLNSLNNVLKKLDVQFIYRPHPGDDIRLFENLDDNLIISHKSETLRDCFDSGDIFISYNSTSLVEASMLSKTTIQLLDYPHLQSDNFEKLGICNKTVSSVNGVENYIKYLSDSTNEKLSFNRNYIDYGMNSWEIFFEHLAHILK